MATKQWKITNAPSKWELMLALFDSSNSRPRTVDFLVECEDGHSVYERVSINRVSKEDGSGESWCFEGIAIMDGKHSCGVKGWFRTSDRHGWIQFLG